VPRPVEIVDLLLGKPSDPELVEQLHQSHAMQIVKPGPGQFTLAHLGHLRLIKPAPGIGEGRRIDHDAAVGEKGRRRDHQHS